jgi:hypothetical protein
MSLLSNFEERVTAEIKSSEKRSEKANSKIEERLTDKFGDVQQSGDLEISMTFSDGQCCFRGHHHWESAQRCARFDAKRSKMVLTRIKLENILSLSKSVF